MGVTDEDAQMDLNLYIGNFDLKSIFFSQNQIRKNITSAKSILISLLDLVDSSNRIIIHGKSEETYTNVTKLT